MKNIIFEKIKKTLIKFDYYDDSLKINLTTPKNKDFGNLSTNISFLLAKKLRKNPLEIADIIKNDLEKLNIFKKIEIAGSGFINFYLNPKELFKHLNKILEFNKDYGKNQSELNKTALVEFVSANPTGPLTVGHGRGAILGDTISNILYWNGYNVEREYYYNNAGRQMRVLAESVQSRYFEMIGEKANFPEDGYQGDYIKDIAKNLFDKYNNSLHTQNNPLKIAKSEAEKYIFNDINNTLKKLNIKFDSFFNENELYENKAIYKVIDKLKKINLIYEKDGAVWFHGSKVGRENDRVLIKSTGEPTYRLPDMAYHIDKLERSYDLCIDIFGSDHMDAYPDVLEVVHQLGYDKSKIKVLIHQFISILKDGKQVKMSTRKATFNTLDDLINQVGSDVVRYFFIMRGINSHLNFDLEIAKEKSEKNPIFYIQYAHARIKTILNKNKLNYENCNLSLLGNDEELVIINKLIQFEELIIKLKNQLEPQMLANYLFDLSSLFHKYYAKNRVINNEDEELSKNRLVLIKAISIVINNGLEILGINCPDNM
mgnify:CR=1 FL=1